MGFVESISFMVTYVRDIQGFMYPLLRISVPSYPRFLNLHFGASLGMRSEFIIINNYQDYQLIRKYHRQRSNSKLECIGNVKM